jgi:cytochrome c553
MVVLKRVICTMLASAFLMSSVVAAPLQPKARGAQNKDARTVTPKPQPQGDPVAGKEKAESERCLECHGLDGNGAGHADSSKAGTEGKFAKLAGQYPDYILKQIRDFRSGARKHDQMAIMARSVSDEDVLDIAAYFGSLPRMSGEGGDARALGKALFAQGDPARGVQACVSCHGDKGKGLPGTALGPVVGGQAWRYLDKQLRDWRSGERRNSAEGVMSQASRALTDQDIEALADYLSGM